MDITSFDIVVLVIIVLSALYGMGRGFTMEVLSLLSWVGAAFVALYGFPLIQPWARSVMEPEAFADTVAIVVLGVVALIILKLLAGIIGKSARESDLGLIDRGLGGIFGLARGLFVVCVFFLVINWLIPRKSFPDWIANAKTLPLVEFGAELIASITPAEIIERLDDLDGGGKANTLLDTGRWDA
jgi:membrane protein required for colicin V production